MKRYKVIPLALYGRAKKIYRTGDIVTQDNLIVKAEELVSKGFLEELPDEEVPTKEFEPPAQPVVENEPVKEPITEAKAESKAEQEQPVAAPLFASAAGIAEEVSDEPVKSIDDITRKEIIKELKERGVEFDENANKKTLYEIWVKK